jgi:hydrogenase/urease accessory protein HupE
MKQYLALFFLLCCLLSTTSRADNMRPASLTIEAVDQTHLNISWKVPAKGGKRLKLDVIFDKSSTLSQPKQARFFANAYIETWQIKRINGLAEIAFTIDGLSKTPTDVLIRIIDLQNQTITSVLNADQPSYRLKGELKDQATISTYIILGIEHILIGFDHLLFVACLVFISRTKKKLLLTITGFTLAHSLTLIMAATGVVSIAIEPVEAVIALSIVFLAVEIAKQNPHSLSFKYPVLVSASFGLLHGFGFASVLAEIGLPKDEKITALLCFNVGVELGQLIFIAALALLFWLIKLIKPTIKLHNFNQLISYFSGSMAMVWLLNRLAQF